MSHKLKLSVSAMQTFDSCKKKYQYNYILKPSIKKIEQSHLEVGKFVHRVFELFHIYLKAQPLPKSEWKALLKKCSDNALGEFSKAILEKEATTIKKIFKDYLDMITKEGLPNVVACEKPFELMVGDYLLKGFIDRVDEEEEGVYHVYDYKTSKSDAYMKPFQLEVYALILKEEFPDLKQVKGSFLMLKLGCKKITYDITDATIDSCRQKIIKYGESILSEMEWEKTRSPLCKFCDFEKICNAEEDNFDNWVLEE